MFQQTKSRHYFDTVGYVLWWHHNCKMWY